jgi:multidrug efflux pump subunit AcrA (membrane-fusion protein)
MFRMRRRLVGGMIVGATTGAVVGHYAAKRQFQSMSAAQAQQAQIDQAQAQAQAQAAQAAQEVQGAQAAQATQGANQGQKDITQQLQDLASLKQKGILTEEEFQQMKARILSNF